MSEKPRCGPTSAELRTSIASFMQRADEVRAHPLGGKNSTFKVTMSRNVVTGETKPVGLGTNPLPKADWIYLAVLIRPIVFAEQEPISFNVLTKRIEREHIRLRGRLKMVRDGVAAWRKHTFVGPQVLGSGEPLEAPQEPESILVALGFGATDDGPKTELSNDYIFAWEYLNANVWHADADKAARYQASSDEIKRHYAKCAEIRTLNATGLVLQLQQWILDARADGHDF
ncbi:hypothetical protein [Nocardioides mesophilus]|uniref:Uncharacterized protein n=1 Tax=Nocardioides mesophilus TaxID=433659 RepID=A0A7G9RDA3_9ACTN|nr:hypothetical protein [Nocardioides mesophilus]QNN53578.1 hypothetical protein H9L09_03885 [Nocardioides mesophilus]